MAVPEIKRVKSLREDNARLKKLIAEAMLDNEAIQVALGKVLTIDQKCEAVMLKCDATGRSRRRACKLTGCSCRPAAMTDLPPENSASLN